MIQAASLSGADLGAYCRERGLFPKQLARWRHVAEDAKNHRAPSLSDQKELQHLNQELISPNRRLGGELQKKEKALAVAATLLMFTKSAIYSGHKMKRPNCNGGSQQSDRFS